MSTSCNSPYQQSLPLVNDICPVVSKPDDQFLTAAMLIPGMAPYELDLQDFYVTGDCQPDVHTGPIYNTAYSHLTPKSEPCSDLQDCITPLSLQVPFNYHDSPQASPGLASFNMNLAVTSCQPRSSPSPFLRQRNMWTQQIALKREGSTSQITPATSPRPQHCRTSSAVSDSTIYPPQLRQYTTIAPNPASIGRTHSAKRSYSGDEFENTPVSKRIRSAPMSPDVNTGLSEEDELLLRLKDDENLSWKEIQSRFQTDMSKTFHVPALQMRLKRLRERLRTWSDVDVEALRLAHDYWHSNKFEIIAAKMAEFGAQEKWSSKQCYKKWNEIAVLPDLMFPTYLNRTPIIPKSYTSSPVGGPPEGYYPFSITSAA